MGWSRPTITRRGLFRATTAAGVTVAAVGLLSGCTHTEESAEEPLIVDKSKATYVIDPETNESNFSFVDSPLVEGISYNVAVGTVLRPSEGNWIAATSVGSTAHPVVIGSALSLDSGNVANVVTSTISSDEPSCAIFDVACSDSAYAWVEMDLLTKSWVLYASAFADGELTGSPSKLWEADANWDPPRMAVTGTSVIWQVMPSMSGDKITEHSHCYLWRLGGSDAKAVVESPGRFATQPEVSGNSVTLAPRVRADEGVFYGITAYSLADNMETVLDQLVLPQSVSPMSAVWIDGRFAFSVEASYSAEGVLANMGTFIGTNANDLVVLSREPAAEVAGKQDTFIVKNRSSYFVINVRTKEYSTLAAADRSVDYGDFPARVGYCDTFATFATVKDPNTGYPTSVVVRTFGL